MWKNEAGFTIMELVIALFMVVILIGMAVMNLGLYNDKNIAIQVKSEAQIALDTSNVYMLSTSNFDERELGNRLEKVLEKYNDDPTNARRYEVRLTPTPSGTLTEVIITAVVNKNLTIEATLKPLDNSMRLKGIGNADTIESLVNNGVLDE